MFGCCCSDRTLLHPSRTPTPQKGLCSDVRDPTWQQAVHVPAGRVSCDFWLVVGWLLGLIGLKGTTSAALTSACVSVLLVPMTRVCGERAVLHGSQTCVTGQGPEGRIIHTSEEI